MGRAAFRRGFGRLPSTSATHAVFQLQLGAAQLICIHGHDSTERLRQGARCHGQAWEALQGNRESSRAHESWCGHPACCHESRSTCGSPAQRHGVASDSFSGQHVKLLSSARNPLRVEFGRRRPLDINTRSWQALPAVEFGDCLEQHTVLEHSHIFGRFSPS